jgi:hypothetical protein
MNLLDILYTPLDLPEPPVININHLFNWIDQSRSEQEPFRNFLRDAYIADDNSEKFTWPWNMGLAYLNWEDHGPGWLSKFDKEFPELSQYFYTVFDIPLEDLGTVVILPVKKKHTGQGVMHMDHDDFGLRVYLEFEHIGQNKLLMQKTRVPYLTRPKFTYPIDQKLLQKEVIECKTFSPRGCWYINNARAVHGTWTEVEDSTRIAVIVSGNPRSSQDITSRIQNKIITSAEKYKDYAVLWQGN